MTNDVPDTFRAWAEIDLSALRDNMLAVRSKLPPGCGIMAVVKADAYGHGAQQIAAQLHRAGVDTFAVVTLCEGIELRESGLDGQIMVMGYTPPEGAKLLEAHDLTQVIASAEHAEALDKTGCKLTVHIAIDTGMHRLGFDAEDLAGIESVYACKNLKVEGMGTHLAVPDSLDPGDVEFTNRQCRQFYDTVNALQGRGYDTGKLHIQSSYGVFNHPEIKCDYVRTGIALYGALDRRMPTNIAPRLTPVLSLRARVAQVRRISAGESVSYGRTFSATQPMKLATVSIGYADGVPRRISGSGAVCLIHGRRAPIVGRICMDMLMIDVTDIDSVRPGDVVTLLGKDGDGEILCDEFAAWCGTITHEILCRLGKRLPRVYIDG